MRALLETPGMCVIESSFVLIILVGFALFRVLDESRLDAPVDEILSNFSTFDDAKELYALVFSDLSLLCSVALQECRRFQSMDESLAAAVLLLAGNLPEALNSFIAESVVANGGRKLAVLSHALGTAIHEKFNLEVVCNDRTMAVFRGIRSHLVCFFRDIAIQSHC
jgi:hypothetical protein